MILLDAINDDGELSSPSRSLYNYFIHCSQALLLFLLLVRRIILIC